MNTPPPQHAPAIGSGLEGAKEGSRKLDWSIAGHFDEIPKHSVREIGFDYEWFRHPDEYVLWKATDSEGRSVDLWTPPPVTTSLDAALELLERKLPGWRGYGGQCMSEGTGCFYYLRSPAFDSIRVGDPDTAPIATTPLAICIALLKALEADQSGRQADAAQVTADTSGRKS